MKRVFLIVLGIILAYSIPANAAIEHVRFADGSSQTLYEIEIPAGISPEQIDSVTILRNDTPLSFVKEDFSLWRFGSFLGGHAVGAGQAGVG